jgi:DNA-binding MarR family transcriptional regulator
LTKLSQAVILLARIKGVNSQPIANCDKDGVNSKTLGLWLKQIFLENGRCLMTSTRDRVLNTLLTRPRCTINDLAESVGINPISVRHHISKLEAEGLVDSDEELHGVGRPRRVYFLTESGLERFPTRYMQLTIRLLEKLKETLPEQAIKQLICHNG